MKKIILSVAVATMALSTSAMAIDNVKANGLAKLIYQTHSTDATTVGGTNGKSFGAAMSDDGTRANSQGQASIMLGLTADLSKNLSAGVEVTGVSTLGLENGLVGDTIAATNLVGTYATDPAATKLEDQFWISQAYFTYSMGKTTAKIGMQELNTPFVFTEKWNVSKNTFQAMVLVNNDIENVTLVGAYVGKHNGSTDQRTTNFDGVFQTFGASGAYAAGAIAKVQGVNLQAWGFNVNSLANTYWLEADTKVAGIFIGGQYAGYNPEATGAKSTNAYAVKAAGNVAGATLYAAYASVSDGTGNTDYANVSTGDKTKLYTGTASIYGDGGRAAQEDTKSWKVGAKGEVAGFGLGAAYSAYDKGLNNGNNAAQTDYDVIDFFVAKKVGPVALKAIYTDFETEAAGSAATSTKTIRVIASAKF